LFLGPDEGTAEFMNWASAHARERGASFWKVREEGGAVSMVRCTIQYLFVTGVHHWQST